MLGLNNVMEMKKKLVFLLAFSLFLPILVVPTNEESNPKITPIHIWSETLAVAGKIKKSKITAKKK